MKMKYESKFDLKCFKPGKENINCLKIKINRVFETLEVKYLDFILQQEMYLEFGIKIQFMIESVLYCPFNVFVTFCFEDFHVLPVVLRIWMASPEVTGFSYITQ
jgi:hypothetical protein